MPPTVRGADADGLERSCGRKLGLDQVRTDRLRRRPGRGSTGELKHDRADPARHSASYSGEAFSPTRLRELRERGLDGGLVPTMTDRAAPGRTLPDLRSRRDH